MQTLTQINEKRPIENHFKIVPSTFVRIASTNDLSETTTNNYIGTKGASVLLKITTLNDIFRFFAEPEDIAKRCNLMVFKFTDRILNGRHD